MKLYGLDQVVGNSVKLKATAKNHYRVAKSQPDDDRVVKSFGDMLGGAFGKVNNLQLKSDKLTKDMIVHPESVSIHSVMIAAQKAELAISLTKSITDRMIKAYQNITNLR